MRERWTSTATVCRSFRRTQPRLGCILNLIMRGRMKDILCLKRAIFFKSVHFINYKGKEMFMIKRATEK